MMDYTIFLKELEDQYREKNMEFKCSYNQGVGNFLVSIDSNAPELQKEITWNKNSKSFSCQSFNKTFSFKVFQTIAEAVYYLAWELASVIGRLPDHIHARMVLSTDKSPFLKKYVENFC